MIFIAHKYLYIWPIQVQFYHAKPIYTLWHKEYYLRRQANYLKLA